MPELQCLVFGPFRLDRHDERLWCGREALLLSPQTFAVLSCLVSQAGRLVTKDALLDAVWPETVVSEPVITSTVRKLLRALQCCGTRGRRLNCRGPCLRWPGHTGT